MIVRAASDATYDCAYLVSAVPTSTTLTATTALPGTGCSPSGSGATGGTLQTSSAGIRFAHYTGSSTPEVASILIDNIFIQGDYSSNPVNCLEADAGGNVKDFQFRNLQFNACHYGVNGFTSGTLGVYGYTFVVASIGYDPATRLNRFCSECWRSRRARRRNGSRKYALLCVHARTWGQQHPFGWNFFAVCRPDR